MQYDRLYDVIYYILYDRLYDGVYFIVYYIVYDRLYDRRHFIIWYLGRRKAPNLKLGLLKRIAIC